MNHAFIQARNVAGAEFDRTRMASALRASGGVVQRAAAGLGVTDNYFWIRAKAIGLNIAGIRAELKAREGVTS